MSAHKRYLGEGAYVDLDQYGNVILTAENGIIATDTVVLEPAALLAFLRWLDRVKQAQR